MLFRDVIQPKEFRIGDSIYDNYKDATTPLILTGTEVTADYSIMANDITYTGCGFRITLPLRSVFNSVVIRFYKRLFCNKVYRIYPGHLPKLPLRTLKNV
jgi:hypothetical protein